MPELPDLAIYVHALTALVAGRRLVEVRLLNPFVLRSVDPGIESIKSRTVERIFRVGKRIVFELGPPDGSGSSLMPSTTEKDVFLVGLCPRLILAALEFEHGTLFFAEAPGVASAPRLVVANTNR